MNLLSKPIDDFEWIESARDNLKKSTVSIRVAGCQDNQKQHMINALAAPFDAAIIVSYSDVKAREICEEYSFYDSNVMYYPAKDLIFYQSDINSKQIEIERMKVVRAMLSGEKVTVVTTIDAFMTPMISPEIIMANVISLQKKGIVDEKALSYKLVSMGYEKCYQVEAPGQFSVRGDIVDIFDLCMSNPVRIELWGDEIESIRSFDVLSQRSIEILDEVTIMPGTELILTEEQKLEGFKAIEAEAVSLEEQYRSSFKTEEAHRLKMQLEEVRAALIDQSIQINLESYIKYFYPDCGTFASLLKDRNSCIFLDEPDRIAEHASAVELEFNDSMEHRLEKGYVLPTQADILRSFSVCMADISRMRTVMLTALVGSVNGTSILPLEGDYYVSVKMIPSYNGSFNLLVKNLKDLKKKKYKVIIVSPSRSRAKRLADDLMNEDVIATYTEDENRQLQPGEIVTFYGRISKGFEYPEIKFVVISEVDIFGAETKKKKRNKPKYTGGQKVSSAGELNIGDYIIHENHGLGIYRGIEKVKVESVLKDYMKIEYRDGGNLYVLATNLDAIGLYATKDAKPPKLNKLGSPEWNKTKAGVKESVGEVAKELVHLYAVRNEKKGYQFGKDTVWQKEFEEMFPYEETSDQLNAIAATKDDMESTKIMDRLVCGDVGFGKTEIAIRAAFKAVQEGKQVAYLVPTTILAQQHYNTFKERMKDYPVRIEMLSRFCSAAEIRKTISDLKKGLVDIVIGTHRLISKDVEFSALGLLVIDEEQRFGVTHKEKIKQLRENVDVLTLTATPIPRTLHMSLIGIRDLSLLEEAPSERLPIQTYVMEYNEEMVREAINRELARKGQVYYVYNRVDNIDMIASKISELVPEANIAFAHGQMKENELERIMTDFVNHEIDVLVATTIIETGLDIPNVNTMIIHDSDSLGLSQLYQLRGRVGRSNRTSFAFLMYKRNKVLKEVAEKRLLAIKEFTELGSGFKIAMRDLEIRGAGTLLGKKQHGHIEAVGYDLYCKMLDAAIKEERGISQAVEKSAAVDLDVDAFIPENYIVNEAQKLDIYKRIASLWTEEDVEEMRDELKDRFGDVPREAENLLRIAMIKKNAGQLYITDIRGRAGRIKVVMQRSAPVNTSKIPFLLNEYGGDLRLQPLKEPEFILVYEPDILVEKDALLLLEHTEKLLENMKMLYE